MNVDNDEREGKNLRITVGCRQKEWTGISDETLNTSITDP
jgi:hypothetical protein